MNYAVILAGGVGSRFWPFSRELEPKQFMKIIGEESLLQTTVKRIKGLIIPSNTFIITNKIYYYELLSQIKNLGIPEENIILEPEGKNTAPAIGLCAKLIGDKDKNAVLVVLPADHYIKNVKEFKLVIKKAIVSAKNNFLVTIGIKPANPSTGYGYIKTKDRVKGYQKVEKFFEKPSQDKASIYFKNKNFYWNSGMFIWKASVFLDEVKKYLPGLYKQLKIIKSKDDINKVWPKIKPISVDYGIMEHAKGIVLVPATFYWTDVGSWDALREVFPKDSRGNVSSGDIINLGSTGVCAFSKGNRLISTIGLKDIIIADTPDALLVCDKNKTQEVKNLVNTLKSRNRREHIVHLTERRPWGSFTILQEGLGFKIKLIEINPYKRLSLQRHKSRSEHWVVVSGRVNITIGKSTFIANKNQSVYVPMGIKHRLQNSTKLPVRIVEVQTGGYLGEDDIERFDDDFKKEYRR